MSPVPSLGANSASSTYGGGTSSAMSAMSSNVSTFQTSASQTASQPPTYPVCYAQSIVPVMRPAAQTNSTGGGGGGGGLGPWVGRFHNNSNAAYSGSSDGGGKICNL